MHEEGKILAALLKEQSKAREKQHEITRCITDDLAKRYGDDKDKKEAYLVGLYHGSQISRKECEQYQNNLKDAKNKYLLLYSALKGVQAGLETVSLSDDTEYRSEAVDYLRSFCEYIAEKAGLHDDSAVFAEAMQQTAGNMSNEICDNITKILNGEDISDDEEKDS